MSSHYSRSILSGDTMFASGEALYDRLSPSFAAYLETLEAVHSGETFIEEVKRNGGGLWQGERGSPFNKNQDLVAIHPVVRTNPVTGKKAVFVNKGFTKSIVGLTVGEGSIMRLSSTMSLEGQVLGAEIVLTAPFCTLTLTFPSA